MGQRDDRATGDEVATMSKPMPADLEALEAGEDAPTYAQLEKLVHRLFKWTPKVFFLSSGAPGEGAAARIPHASRYEYA